MTSKPKTVLIVDDDEGMRDTLTAILKREYRVLRVGSGEAALPVLNKEDVDLVLLDVRLPGISGFEVLRIVKENYSLVEVIMISAINEIETAVQAMKHGAYHYITKEFDYDNPMEVPRIAKVVVNIGIGEAKDSDKALDAAVGDVVTITGQKPALIKARKSVAAFKLRAGMPVGIRTTLRGRRMYYFLEKLINVALPRIRDFRGVSPEAFDGRGNYTLGLREQIIFPEVDYDKIDKLRGLEITVVTTAKTDEEGRSLLTQMGMPFRKRER